MRDQAEIVMNQHLYLGSLTPFMNMHAFAKGNIAVNGRTPTCLEQVQVTFQHNGIAGYLFLSL